MAASPALREFPIIRGLIARMKRFSDRATELSELRGLNEQEINAIAREFGLSRSEFFKLCANRTRGDLLRPRLAEFGLTEELLAKKEPEVLRDLQRVCGTCTTALRCASDSAAHRDSGRDEYCPNTSTLYALKQEGWRRKDGVVLRFVKP